MAAVAPAPEEEDYVAADAAKLAAPHVEDDERQGGCCCCCGTASSSLARRATSWCRRKLVSRPVVCRGPTEPAAKRVLVAVAAGTEPLEAATAADILDRAGARVTVATASSGLIVEAGHGVRFAADARVAGLEAEEFDLIVLPGGMAGSANLRDCKPLEKMVRKHAEKGRMCGAIGAAPAVVLARWGVLQGFKATCHPALLGRLGDGGVIAVDDRVVKDRNVVTSQGIGTAIEFALALVEQLYGQRTAEEVAGPLYMRPKQGVKYSIQEYNQVQWKCTGTPRVLVPVANGSEEMEALNLIDVLRRASARVTVASVEDVPRIVTRHYKLNLIADVMLEQAAEMEFDLIVMPGGLPGALKFTSTDKLVGMLKKQAESGRPYGAICASPAYVLEPHGLLKGKKATSFPPMAHLLTDQSACEYRVVVDGNLMTSRAPGTATEFALAIVEKLFGEEKAVAIAKELVFM
ncbi:protein DJ-1 homolog A-like [Triticum dicoccoides]|uniref:protein DJ-1 homolog A-like n=1 Tax=Triticum dicoccoides TaxID=85692 RepID=UPI0018905B5C|nr:protein DJ-1 homolog A-like [Triticum dicoccoides]